MRIRQVKSVPVSEVEIGSVIGSDVLDASGNILLGKGTSISERQKAILARRGIESVMVQEPGDLPSPEDTAEEDTPAEDNSPEDGPSPAVLERLAAIEHAFSDCREQPQMQPLYRLAIAHVARGELDG